MANTKVQEFTVKEDCYVVIPRFSLNRARTISRETVETDAEKDVVKETKLFRDREETKWIEHFYGKHRRRIKNVCIDVGFGLVASESRKGYIEEMLERMQEEIQLKNLRYCSVSVQVYFFHIVSQNTLAVDAVLNKVLELRDTLKDKLLEALTLFKQAEINSNSFTKEKSLLAINTRELKELSATLLVGKDVIVDKEFGYEANKIRERVLKLHEDIKKVLNDDDRGRFSNLTSTLVA